jgi:hypothetical protein
MQNKKEIISYVVWAAIIVLILSSFVYFNNKNKPESLVVSTLPISTDIEEGDTLLDIFAKCITRKDFTMYGAVWCSHCLNEKNAFGDSFRFIQYVECPDNISLCVDKGINGYPTWADSLGNKYEGEQGLAGLAKITGCELPK